MHDLQCELPVAGPDAETRLRGASRQAVAAARVDSIARVNSMVTERLDRVLVDEAELFALARIHRGGELFDRAVALFPRPEGGLASATSDARVG